MHQTPPEADAASTSTVTQKEDTIANNRTNMCVSASLPESSAGHAGAPHDLTDTTSVESNVDEPSQHPAMHEGPVKFTGRAPFAKTTAGGRVVELEGMGREEECAALGMSTREAYNRDVGRLLLEESEEAEDDAQIAGKVDERANTSLESKLDEASLPWALDGKMRGSRSYLDLAAVLDSDDKSAGVASCKDPERDEKVKMGSERTGRVSPGEQVEAQTNTIRPYVWRASR